MTENRNDLIQQLQNFVFDHPETRLIVIDTLYLAREGGDGTAYSYSSDYKDIRPFKLFTDAYDLALILVHHTNKKPDEGNPFNQISGTNGLLGAADGGFVLCAEQEKRFLHCIGRDLPMQHYELQFDRETCLWELIRSCKSAAELVPEPLLDVIDAVVEDQWQGTASELFPGPSGHFVWTFKMNTHRWQSGMTPWRVCGNLRRTVMFMRNTSWESCIWMATL